MIHPDILAAALAADAAAEALMLQRIAAHEATACTCGGTGNPFQPHAADCERQRQWTAPRHAAGCSPYPGVCRTGCEVTAYRRVSGRG